MNDAMKQQLINRFQGMSSEELELFADMMPVELCMKRIQKELDKSKDFENAIRNAMSMVD